MPPVAERIDSIERVDGLVKAGGGTAALVAGQRHHTTRRPARPHWPPRREHGRDVVNATSVIKAGLQA